MTTLVLPLLPSASHSSLSLKALEAVQLLRELGFGHESPELAEAQPNEKLRILLTQCGKCWGISN
jgi:hypothetical protein